MQSRDILLWSSIVIGLIIGFWRLPPPAEQAPPAEPAIPEQQEAEVSVEPAVTALPDFAAIREVKAKKEAFFDFIRPLVEQENQRILALRQRLQGLQQQAALSEQDHVFILGLAQRYRVKHQRLSAEQLFSELLKRVDTVPVSLALSQSANESAWGVSRFAVEGNNLFGQWCFKPGCGIVPARRGAGAEHEVAKFSSPQASVRGYIHNLNTNSAYEDFRFLRREQRRHQQTLSGLYLAGGLMRYSGRGADYIAELQAMIRVNKLMRFDLI